MSVLDLWRRTVQEVERRVPDATSALNTPSLPSSLLEAERLLDQALPDDLQSVYGQHNGQSGRTVSGLFFGMVFMPVEDSLRFVQDVQHWHRDAPDLAEEESHSSQPPDAILPFTSHPRWWPFASDGGGGYLALDFAPGINGHRGQVIQFGAGFDPVHVVAPSFSAFLTWYLAQLQAGNAVVVPAAGLTAQRLEIAQPRRSILTEAIPELYRAGQLPSGR